MVLQLMRCLCVFLHFIVILYSLIFLLLSLLIVLSFVFLSLVLCFIYYVYIFSQPKCHSVVFKFKRKIKFLLYIPLALHLFVFSALFMCFLHYNIMITRTSSGQTPKLQSIVLFYFFYCEKFVQIIWLLCLFFVL